LGCDKNIDYLSSLLLKVLLSVAMSHVWSG
jgi:hypothetical protein